MKIVIIILSPIILYALNLLIILFKSSVEMTKK